MLDRLKERFQSVSVLVAGDVMLDEYIIGSVSRISPEAPVPVLDVHTRKSVLGGAANVAANIAAMGGRAAVIGLAAMDAAGITVRELLAAAGIAPDGLVDCGERGTIHKTRIVAGRQQVVRIDHERREVLPAALEQAAIARAIRMLEGSAVVVISDYAKGLIGDTFCSTLIKESRARRIPIIADPKSQDFAKYRGCTMITPNLSEAARASGIGIDSEASLRRAGSYLLSMLPETTVLITRGQDGMTLFHEGEAPLTVPTTARQVFDVVGAGDTVIAALAVSIGAEFPLVQAMRLANIAAGIVVGKPGTATASVDEILAYERIQEIAGHL